MVSFPFDVTRWMPCFSRSIIKAILLTPLREFVIFGLYQFSQSGEFVDVAIQNLSILSPKWGSDPAPDFGAPSVNVRGLFAPAVLGGSFFGEQLRLESIHSVRT